MAIINGNRCENGNYCNDDGLIVVIMMIVLFFYWFYLSEHQHTTKTNFTKTV